MLSNPPTARGSVTITSTTNVETNYNNSNSNNNEASTLICETPKLNGTLQRCFIGEQGKRARFYRNGDQFFKGFWYTISAFRSWDSLLEDLNHHLGDSIALPHGVRFIFTVDGKLCLTLEELEHGLSYVCSSTDKFKAIDYANASQPIWSFVSSQRSAPPSRGLHSKCEKEPNDFVKPRIITIIRNGLKPRRVVRHLLNKRTAVSFDHVMQDITAIVKLNSGVVRKLYALSGKQITTLADFFGEDYVFVAYGPEKVSVDDFYVITEEYKRMNLRGGIGGPRCSKFGPAGKCEMPLRNDGFRKTLSPDPKSKMNQVMQLPPELASKIKIVSLLGDGNTALVFKALFKTPNQSITNVDGSLNSERATSEALKIISKENAEEMLDFVETEIQLLSEIQHDYIVAMREYFVVDNSWYIRMELMEEGDLFEYLTKVRTLDEANAASSISCLCEALDYLHNRNIVHRDVKPENLLIYKCPSTGNLKLKLADFGLACKLQNNELLYHLCGTPTYVAPEVLAEFGYSYKADCWSVGIILYILLCGFPPFGMDEDLILFNKIIRGVFDFPSPSFDEISFAARLLTRRLLSTEPKIRYSARQVLDNLWIQQLGNITAEIEQDCMVELEEAMAAIIGQNNEFEESDTEYFYSRRASMDELSECATTSIIPTAAIVDDGGDGSVGLLSTFCTPNSVIQHNLTADVTNFTPSSSGWPIDYDDSSATEIDYLQSTTASTTTAAPTAYSDLPIRQLAGYGSNSSSTNRSVLAKISFSEFPDDNAGSNNVNYRQQQVNNNSNGVDLIRNINDNNIDADADDDASDDAFERQSSRSSFIFWSSAKPLLSTTTTSSTTVIDASNSSSMCDIEANKGVLNNVGDRRSTTTKTTLPPPVSTTTTTVSSARGSAPSGSSALRPMTKGIKTPLARPRTLSNNRQ